MQDKFETGLGQVQDKFGIGLKQIQDRLKTSLGQLLDRNSALATPTSVILQNSDQPLCILLFHCILLHFKVNQAVLKIYSEFIFKIDLMSSVPPHMKFIFGNLIISSVSSAL